MFSDTTALSVKHQLSLGSDEKSSRTALLCWSNDLVVPCRCCLTRRITKKKPVGRDKGDSKSSEDVIKHRPGPADQ